VDTQRDERILGHVEPSCDVHAALLIGQAAALDSINPYSLAVNPPGGQMSEQLSDNAAELSNPWRVPGSQRMPAYGASAAVNAVGTVAAPLLAGFSLTFVGQLLGGQSGPRWPDLTLLLLIIAGLAFIGSLQCALRARQWDATPKDISDWWPNSESDKDLQIVLYQQQAMLKGTHEVWATISILFFHTGIISLFVAMATLLVPSNGSTITPLRTISIILIASAAVVEFGWMLFRELVIKDEATASVRRTWNDIQAMRRHR
jgi:MFS family permease